MTWLNYRTAADAGIAFLFHVEHSGPRMRFILFTALLLLCVGCKHGYPITNRAPFADYVGRDLTLKRAAVLVKARGFEIGPPAMENADFTNSFDFRYFRSVAILPARTVVRLDKINFAWDEEAGAGAFMAFGSATLPDTKHAVKFTYFWGMIDKIARAPWDDDSVPSERFVVGTDGRKLEPR